jgi:hypothetical protein
VYGNLVEETGALIIGRRTHDNSIPEWGGKGRLGEVRCFVVTHQAIPRADPVFTFVTDGIDSALAKAQEVAGGKRIGLVGATSTSSSSRRASWTRSRTTWSTSCSVKYDPIRSASAADRARTGPAMTRVPRQPPFPTTYES